MKRTSASVPIGILAMVSSLILAGCDDKPQDVKACADKNGKIVDDSFCNQQPVTAGGSNPNADDHFLRDMLIYRWVFGGNYSGGYATHYAYYPSPSVIYVSPRSSVGSSIITSGSSAAYSTSVSRGGFGGSFAGGEGGGE